MYRMVFQATFNHWMMLKVNQDSPKTKAPQILHIKYILIMRMSTAFTPDCNVDFTSSTSNTFEPL
jgi:peroxiredoxin